MNKILLIIGLLYVVSCSSREVKIAYFDNGNIRFKRELLDGKEHGMLYYYYEDGQLESISEWENGLEDGFVEIFRRNGILKSRGFYKRGKLEGVAKSYFDNGQLQSQVNYKNGVKVGEAIYYRGNGTLEGINVYNEEGRMIDSQSYNEDGSLDKTAVSPIYYAEKDTINIGEEIVYEVRIANRVLDKMSAMVGEPDETNLGWLKDTTAIFKEDNYVLTHTFKPTKLGVDSIIGRVYNYNENVDTIYRFGFTFTYFVQDTL